MRISDWSSDVCSSDLEAGLLAAAGKHELAEQWVADWQGATDGRLHLELTRTGRDGEDEFNAFALHASGRRGVPVVASNDVRFLDREDRKSTRLNSSH